MKKKVIIAILTIVILGGAGFGIWYGLNSAGSEAGTSASVYVQSVSQITGYGNLGASDRYTGVVETQQSLKVNKDDTKTIKTIFVKAGDEVQVGDQLFEYDTDEMALTLDQHNLELEQLANSIEYKRTQITSLEKEKASAANDQKLEYTMQIQTLESEIKQAEFDQKSKELEIKKTQESIDNAVIYSTMAGTVKEVNETTAYDQSTGEAKPFISITSMGDYRIKGAVSEMTAAALMEGQEVIVRSRIDQTVTWKGTISSIDLENQVTDTNNYYYGSTGEQAAKYPFYVELNDSNNDLMLGQHVLIELDYGQDEAADGLHLPDAYLVLDGENPYVWAADENDQLVKKEVTLGEYNADMFTYEILDGLAGSDYIAWPDETCKEGVSVTRYENSGVPSDTGVNMETVSVY